MVKPLSSRHGTFLFGLMAATSGFPPAPCGPAVGGEENMLDRARPSHPPAASLNTYMYCSYTALASCNQPKLTFTNSCGMLLTARKIIAGRHTGEMGAV